ncbi:patatin-like phospholipase family protein [candidate division KSB1 bacterium]|nr:patatin-like phospholipase family protein [candidate division KSB1 bacterium]
MAQRFAILLLFLPLLIGESSLAEPNRPTVGLVLSGGGAKGFAHVGVLKTLDSLKIPIDYIAGTSMGGIVGGLYAVGYSAIELEKIARATDWEEVFSDMPTRRIMPFLQKRDVGRYQLEFGLKGLRPQPPSGLIFGQKIALLFNSLTFPFERTNHFDDLPIPFRCIAVDLVTGNEVVLDRGSLALAMRATMSIPTVFSPVEWGDSLLVDGGLVNNLPVDVVKAMGAELVIAVDVASDLKPRDQLTSGLAVLEQSLAIYDRVRWSNNRNSVDLYIRPDISEFSVADFQETKVIRLIQQGEKAAREKIAELIALQRRHNLYRAESENRSIAYSPDTRVHSISVYGNTTFPTDVILQNLNIAPGDTFSTGRLREGLAVLKAGGKFSQVQYELTPVNEGDMKISVHVREIDAPLIHGIYIRGNRSLPFSFIYRLIGLNPGDRLDVEQLNWRLMQIYALGYFETLVYNISPVDANHIALHFSIKELPVRRLRVGIRYDDRHKLVGAVSLLGTNLLLPGLRVENELQFAGLTRFNQRISYPSRYMNLPVYPYLFLNYKNIPTYIYDYYGTRIAGYNDRAVRWGGGLGILAGKGAHAELEFREEWLNIKPSVGLDDPLLFPRWKERLRQFRSTVIIDNLDDVLLPRDGVYLRAEHEQSWIRFGSKISYRSSSIRADFYQTLAQRHTLHTSFFFGTGKNQPLYKFFNLGHPQQFLGLNYDQLLANRLSMIRLDYRYMLRSDVFVSLIANTCPTYTYRFDNFDYTSEWIIGYGLAIKFVSPVGPIDVYYTRSDRSPFITDQKQSKIYFTMGYQF